MRARGAGRRPWQIEPQHARLALRRAAIDGYGRAVTLSGADGRRTRRMPAQDRVLILNFHSIEPPRRRASPGVDPAHLDELLGWLMRQARIVTVAELVDTDRWPRVVLSFDDGYRNFAEHALPVLERRGVRVNQNVIPACVDGGRPPWTVELLDALAAVAPARLAGLSDLDPGVPRALARSAPVRYAELLTLRLKHLPHASRQSRLDEIAQRLPELAAVPPRRMLSSAEVRQIARDHEIGAHSFDHESMADESDRFFSEDLDRCQTWFAQQGLGLGVYAFPNGSYRESQVALAGARGIRTLLGGERPAQRSARALSRITMFGRCPRELRARIARALGGGRRP